MIKGKIDCKGRKVKYKVVMKNDENDFDIIVKTKLGKFMIFSNEIIIDKNRYNNDCNKTNYEYEYAEQMISFLNKWDKISNREIREIAEKLIKREVDKDMADINVKCIIRKHIENFNTRGNFYIPEAPHKIPIPECKPCKKD